MTSNTLHPVSTRKGGFGLERGGWWAIPSCRCILGTVDCFSCFPTPAQTARSQPGSGGDALVERNGTKSIHPQQGLHPNHRILESQNGRDLTDHLIPPSLPWAGTPFTRPSCKIVLVWPWGWESHPALPRASHRTDEETSNLSSTWPILVLRHGEKGSEAAFRRPRAKPASSLRRSENRVHWKSAKLQYIGISICQLLNSKTDCLKTESVSYSKFTLNSSPFLHL